MDPENFYKPSEADMNKSHFKFSRKMSFIYDLQITRISWMWIQGEINRGDPFVFELK